MTLLCRCGAVLARGIEVPPPTTADAAGLVFADGEPLTLPGRAFASSEPMQRSSDPARPAPLEFSPQVWMNPEDVEAAVEPVEDHRRLNGCCGLDGCDGPNMRCRVCGTEVGTRQSDCWTSNLFVPRPEATSWVGDAS